MLEKYWQQKLDNLLRDEDVSKWIYICWANRPPPKRVAFSRSMPGKAGGRDYICVKLIDSAATMINWMRSTLSGGFHRILFLHKCTFKLLYFWLERCSIFVRYVGQIRSLILESLLPLWRLWELTLFLNGLWRSKRGEGGWRCRFSISRTVELAHVWRCECEYQFQTLTDHNFKPRSQTDGGGGGEGWCWWSCSWPGDGHHGEITPGRKRGHGIRRKLWKYIKRASLYWGMSWTKSWGG